MKIILPQMSSAMNQGQSPDQLDAAYQFLEEHFTRIGSISEVAAHCNMSEFHFYRKFKERFGRTPYQVLMSLKMHHAKKLIISRNHTISEVAGIAGYEDIFSFSKSFKKFFGVPPSQVREED